jgi:hypothetical protein
MNFDQDGRICLIRQLVKKVNYILTYEDYILSRCAEVVKHDVGKGSQTLPIGVFYGMSSTSNERLALEPDQ